MDIELKGYAEKAWMLNDIIRHLNGGAYYGSSWLYTWPDECTKEDCQSFFGDLEEYIDLEDLFKKIYKNYHSDGLYNPTPEVLKAAHEWDKKLGLPEIEVVGEKEDYYNDAGKEGKLHLATSDLEPGQWYESLELDEDSSKEGYTPEQIAFKEVENWLLDRAYYEAWAEQLYKYIRKHFKEYAWNDDLNKWVNVPTITELHKWMKKNHHDNAEWYVNLIKKNAPYLIKSHDTSNKLTEGPDKDGSMTDDKEDAEEDTWDEFNKLILKVGFNGPSYRGGSYPAKRPDKINEESIPDNMRAKSMTCRVINCEGTVCDAELHWVTQEKFNDTDFEFFLKEVKRAFDYLIEKEGYKKLFRLHVKAHCREGAQFGHGDAWLSFNAVEDVKEQDLNEAKKLLDQKELFKKAYDWYWNSEDLDGCDENNFNKLFTHMKEKFAPLSDANIEAILNDEREPVEESLQEESNKGPFYIMYEIPAYVSEPDVFYSKEGIKGNNRTYHFVEFEDATAYNTIEEAEKDLEQAKKDYEDDVKFASGEEVKFWSEEDDPDGLDEESVRFDIVNKDDLPGLELDEGKATSKVTESIVRSNKTINELKSLVDNIYNELKKLPKPKEYYGGGEYYGGVQLFRTHSNMLEIIKDYKHLSGHDYRTWSEGTYCVKIGGAYKYDDYMHLLEPLKEVFRVHKSEPYWNILIIGDTACQLIGDFGSNYSVYGIGFEPADKYVSRITEGTISDTEPLSRDELEKLEGELFSKLHDNDIYPEDGTIDNARNSLVDLDVYLDINGDWKHEHLLANKLVEDFAKEKNYIVVKHSEQEIGKSDSDWYEAEHHWYLINGEKEETKERVNAFRKMFATESLKKNKKNLKEGYVGQTLRDFLDVCVEASAIDEIVLADNDCDEFTVIFRGKFEDIPADLLDCEYDDFDCGDGKLVVNVGEEGYDTYYDTLDSFLGDYNGDDVEIFEDDVIFTGDKNEAMDEFGDKGFQSFDAPKYICINIHADCEYEPLDEDMKKTKGNDILSTEEFLNWHDGEGGRNASMKVLDSIYDIFDKNGCGEEDDVDVCYNACSDDDKLKISNIIRSATASLTEASDKDGIITEDIENKKEKATEEDWDSCLDKLPNEFEFEDLDVTVERSYGGDPIPDGRSGGDDIRYSAEGTEYGTIHSYTYTLDPTEELVAKFLGKKVEDITKDDLASVDEHSYYEFILDEKAQDAADACIDAYEKGYIDDSEVDWDEEDYDDYEPDYDDAD